MGYNITSAISSKYIGFCKGLNLIRANFKIGLGNSILKGVENSTPKLK